MTVPEIQEGIKQLMLGFYEEYQKGNPRWLNPFDIARRKSWFEGVPSAEDKSRILQMAGTLQAKGYLHEKSPIYFVRYPLILHVEKEFHRHPCERRFPPLWVSAWKLMDDLYKESRKKNSTPIDLAEAAKKKHIIPANYDEKENGFIRHVFQYLTDDGQGYAEYIEPRNDIYLTKIAQRGIEEYEKFTGIAYQHTVQEAIMDTCYLTPTSAYGARPTIVPIYSVTPLVKLAGEALLKLQEHGDALEKVITRDDWSHVLSCFCNPSSDTTPGMCVTHVVSLAEKVASKSLNKAQRNYLAIAALALYAAHGGKASSSDVPYLKKMLETKQLLPAIHDVGRRLIRNILTDDSEILRELYGLLDVIESECLAKKTATKTSRKEEKAKKIAQAVALKNLHPDWPDKNIAAEVGLTQSALSRSLEFRRAKQLAKGDIHRGSKDKEGNLEAVDMDEESDVN